MEEDDDLVREPDAKGVMDLTNRAWIHVDVTVFDYSNRVSLLDLSYNQIHELPPQIGELALLREFRAAFNKLTSVPTEIGKLKRLRKLVLNGNKIKILPVEIGRLEMLEELIVSENHLDSLPATIQMMGALRVLKLQNNKLKSIPYTLAELATLEEVDCSNNEQLDMVPAMWRGDTLSVLFVCRLHRDYTLKMEEMVTTNNDLQKHSQFLEQQQLQIKEKVVEYKNLNDELNKYLSPKDRKKMEEAQKRAQESDEDKKVKIDGCTIC